MHADMASLNSVRRALDELRISPNRTLGQNFLINSHALDRIVASADLLPQDHVLEIGPGLGALTQRILQNTNHLTAIEKDAQLFAWLGQQSWMQKPGVNLINNDARRFDWQQKNLPKSDVKIVANLPYSVSKPLLRNILETWRPHVHSAVITVQKEVAQRLTAQAGESDWGPMGIMATLHSGTKRIFDVSPGCFWPKPEVTSSVVHIAILEKPSVDLTDEKYFWKIVRAAFSQRRKQILNTLLPFAESKQALETLCLQCEVDPRRRPQTLTVSEIQRLAAGLRKK